ncbi:DUF2182 domain-containing protein [Pseudoalteromonas luteoviolacea]|uniref:DUF2182 domain-containing protein n=1 Tax=Pseudoalteromonas luteoviolacea S4054 TaxID=1129367 RepID=A0A0F6AID8_9GAMM|nr:DUF2182 domain-containing protein [Pseudoalteromonas luteoviolacea]AOT08734.1 hypothetical protein S4054249_13105 [Pseudoalteromonas luteoviolacea]AOT13649.1 hypothetical protein S40542_13080 [Pseudoalteromonas luteoviolacea]AOT18562.1 hypothetical protein S4054_13080 [Pseudoalteromonas luteoviolacea]KKE85631.1 hypothetical protein N479_25540 [Pseudoalteromonas luteoviolacea S4054]KZN68166.1 hypothetical protein N481_23230 [Pseudoalteromonas luteoviolacea S4047-1]
MISQHDHKVNSLSQIVELSAKKVELALHIEHGYVRKFMYYFLFFVVLFVASWWMLIDHDRMMSAHQHMNHGPMSTSANALHLLWMILAMMLPMMAKHLVYIAKSLNKRHRLPAMMLFISCYSILWLSVLILVKYFVDYSVSSFQITYMNWQYIAALGFAFAWYWGNHSVLKQAKNLCGSKGVIQVYGAKVYSSCSIYSLKVWLYCFVECGLVMVSMVMVDQHSVGFMILITAILLYDNFLVITKWRSVSWLWLLVALGLIFDVL